ncbi:MAG: hypothetical protein HQL02_07890 [Nitrospirae bacterium]|nr:hypothetical protein [Nitrospirota bacterium]
MSEMDLIKQLNDLKKDVFYDILEIVGRVFIIVKYSEDVLIGNRGFINDEKQEGIMLVFNARMNFAWNDDVLDATLVFGTTAQQCIIPVQYIIAIYSPELQTQFVTSYLPQEGVLKTKSQDLPKDVSAVVEDNIVKVDFTRKKKK